MGFDSGECMAAALAGTVRTDWGAGFFTAAACFGLAAGNGILDADAGGVGGAAFAGGTDFVPALTAGVEAKVAATTAVGTDLAEGFVEEETRTRGTFAMESLRFDSGERIAAAALAETGGTGNGAGFSTAAGRFDRGAGGSALPTGTITLEVGTGVLPTFSAGAGRRVTVSFALGSGTGWEMDFGSAIIDPGLEASFAWEGRPAAVLSASIFSAGFAATAFATGAAAASGSSARTADTFARPTGRIVGVPGLAGILPAANRGGLTSAASFFAGTLRTRFAIALRAGPDFSASVTLVFIALLGLTGVDFGTVGTRGTRFADAGFVRGDDEDGLMTGTGAVALGRVAVDGALEMGGRFRDFGVMGGKAEDSGGCCRPRESAIHERRPQPVFQPW